MATTFPSPAWTIDAIKTDATAKTGIGKTLPRHLRSGRPSRQGDQVEAKTWARTAPSGRGGVGAELLVHRA